MNPPSGGELAANAVRALERYREQERQLEAEIAERVTRLAMVRDFIATLTAAPCPSGKPRAVRGRPPKVVDGPVIDPAELPPEGEQYADKD